MRVETVAVGQPRPLAAGSARAIETAIVKTPVAGPVWIRRLNLEGDRQADLRVHGGELKAVYAYAAEDYEWWRSALGRVLEPAQFGENLTVRGLDMARVAVGDAFRVGEAELVATEPRLPCAKLDLRFGDPKMSPHFIEARRWGVYFRVRTEGRVAAGDEIVALERHPAGIPVYDVARVYLLDRQDRATVARLATLEALSPRWRERFARLLSGEAEP